MNNTNYTNKKVFQTVHKKITERKIKNKQQQIKKLAKRNNNFKYQSRFVKGNSKI